MATSFVSADSLLAIEVGTVNTRAVLFDIVENRYRFLGAGTAPTTAGAPFLDISEGIRLALEQLQNVTGRDLVGGDQQLILPSRADGSGVDKCVATFSAGNPLRVVAVGLLEDVSTLSAQNLAATTYAQVVEVLSLNDRRGLSTRLDAVLRVRPDVVIVAGGTDGGASQSVMKLLDAVGLACYLMPKDYRPQVLFVGNQSLEKEVKSSLGNLTNLHFAANIRPQIETEQLLPAQSMFSRVYSQARIRQIRGVEVLDEWTKGKLMPTATAFARTISFIGKQFTRTRKGVLGVDVGASSTTFVAAINDDLVVHVQPKLGMGEGLPGILSACPIEDITHWLPYELSEDQVRDYIYNKAAYPACLPVTQEDLAVEQVLASQILRVVAQKASHRFPPELPRSEGGFLPSFEALIASGSVLTRTPQRGQALLMLLNALQPAGVMTIALDQNNLTAALGAAAEVNPLLTVQALDTTNFLNLCTVVSPVGHAATGTTILRVRLKYSSGNESSFDVKYGSLETIPLPLGQTASAYLQPFHRFDVGMGGPGRGGSVKKVVGGVLGLVIDARGRPLSLPSDPARRRDLLRKWAWTLGS